MPLHMTTVFIPTVIPRSCCPEGPTGNATDTLCLAGRARVRAASRCSRGINPENGPMQACNQWQAVGAGLLILRHLAIGYSKISLNKA